MISLSLAVAVFVLVWHSLLLFVCIIGCSSAYVSLIPIYFIFLVLISFLFFFLSRRYRNHISRSTLALPDDPPPVSILRPLKGLEANLYENLESTFSLLYPNYEIILCVADHADQALSVARDVLANFPDANARLIIGKL